MMRKISRTENFIILLAVLVFIFASLFIGMRVFYKSSKFQNVIQDELRFLLSADFIKVKFAKVVPKGLFSFYLYKFKLYTIVGEEDVLLNVERLYFTPKIVLNPLAIKFNFDVKIDDDRRLKGSFTRPAFDSSNIRKSKKNDDSFSGDLTLSLNNVPITFFTGLMRKKIAEVLRRNVSGDLTGNLRYLKTYSYDVSSISMVANLQLDNLNVSVWNGDPSVPPERFSLNSISNKVQYRTRTFQFIDPIVVSSQQRPGVVKMKGGIALGENDEADLSLELSGESELFTAFKTLLGCPQNQVQFTVRGLKRISCL